VWAFGPVEAISQVAAGVALVMFKMGGHPVLPRPMGSNAAVAFGAPLGTVRIKAQGFFEIEGLPFAPRFYLTSWLKVGHGAEYALPRPARKPYSGLPYSKEPTTQVAAVGQFEIWRGINSER
jgi:hypothetical protein